MKQDVSSPIVTVRGVSPETRAMANHAARGQEIPLGEWLSEAIHQYAGMSKKSDPKSKSSNSYRRLAATSRDSKSWSEVRFCRVERQPMSIFKIFCPHMQKFSIASGNPLRATIRLTYHSTP